MSVSDLFKIRYPGPETEMDPQSWNKLMVTENLIKRLDECSTSFQEGARLSFGDTRQIGNREFVESLSPQCKRILERLIIQREREAQIELNNALRGV